MCLHHLLILWSSFCHPCKSIASCTFLLMLFILFFSFLFQDYLLIVFSFPDFTSNHYFIVEPLVTSWLIAFVSLETGGCHGYLLLASIFLMRNLLFKLSFHSARYSFSLVALIISFLWKFDLGMSQSDLS